MTTGLVGLALMILPTLIVGNELLILGGVALEDRLDEIDLVAVEDVVHVVETGRPAREKARGAHRALRVGRATRRAMRDLDPLAGAGEEHCVIAHDVAATRGGNTRAIAARNVAAKRFLKVSARTHSSRFA